MLIKKKYLSKSSHLEHILFNLDVGESSPSGCNSKLLKCVSRTNSFPPSQLPFDPNHPYFHSFNPCQNQTLPYSLLNFTQDNLVKCPLNGAGSVSPSPWQRVKHNGFLASSLKEVLPLFIRNSVVIIWIKCLVCLRSVHLHWDESTGHRQSLPR